MKGEDKSEAKGTAKLVTSPSSSRRSIVTNFRTGKLPVKLIKLFVIFYVFFLPRMSLYRGNSWLFVQENT
jgi:hypothetical protein